MKDQIIKVIADNIQKAISTAHKKHLPHDSAENFYLIVAAEIARKVLAVVDQKTGWEDAPSWANWLASNNKGLSQWFEDKPIWDDDLEFWDESTEDGRYKFAGKLSKGKGLIQRPK